MVRQFPSGLSSARLRLLQAAHEGLLAATSHKALIQSNLHPVCLHGSPTGPCSPALALVAWQDTNTTALSPLLREAGAHSNGTRGKGTWAQLSLLKKRTITALTATRFCCAAGKTARHPVPSSYNIPLMELKPAMALPTRKGHARAGKPSLCSSSLLTP